MLERYANVLVHTPTLYWCGTVVEDTGEHITLRPAAWIADTGRYADAFRTGKFREVEPVAGAVTIYLGPGVVVVEWPHPVPRVQI